MIIGKVSGYILFLLLAYQSSNGQADAPIPLVSFQEIVIDTDMPANIRLRMDGGYKEEEGGVRGLIIYRVNATSFVAYERNCTYHPNRECATVNVHSSGLYLIDPCCNSQFSLTDGNSMGGPAWRPLLQYRTQVQGNKIIISDEIIN
jgi:nitrite reductase/ring-hydroxylating ferredoxin subunit